MSRQVPYLAEEAIERDAAALLAEFEHARGIVLEPPIPVEDIVEKHLKLRIEFDDLHARHNIPRPETGQTDILGAIYGDGSIFIDETLDPDENPSREGRYRFTVAHEGGGHWRLHQHLIVEDRAAVRKCVGWFLRMGSSCGKRQRNEDPASMSETAKLNCGRGTARFLPGDLRMLAGEARDLASDRIPFLGVHRNPESTCEAA